MGFRCYSIVVLVLAFVGTAGLGCRREQTTSAAEGEQQRPAPVQSSAKATEPDEKPSADLLAAQRILHLLDVDDRNGALALARTLMDSSEQKVRLIVIDTMGWMGKVAFPELVELMSHKDEITAEAALCAWEQALDEVENEDRRIAEILKAVKAQSRKAMMEDIFGRLDACDEQKSLIALDGFIRETSGLNCNPSARAAFLALAGEDWVSSERTKMLISKRKGS